MEEYAPKALVEAQAVKVARSLAVEQQQQPMGVEDTEWQFGNNKKHVRLRAGPAPRRLLDFFKKVEAHFRAFEWIQRLGGGA